MFIDDPRKSFVINNFSSFYAEVVRQKERAVRELGLLDSLVEKASPKEAPKEAIIGAVGDLSVPKPGDAPLSDNKTTDAAPEETVKTEASSGKNEKDISEKAKHIACDISNELFKILRTQELEATQLAGEFASAYYKEAQYVMAAVADETFLHFDWPGRDYWQEYLIEMRLFGTHVAGRKIFESLDKLLDVRDSTNREMGEIYLAALGVGFLGKYRDTKKILDIDGYKERLFTFATHTRPALFEGEMLLFPETEEYTIKDATPKGMVDPKQWYMIFCGTFFALLVASYGAWHHATRDLKTGLEILEKTRQEVESRQYSTEAKESTGKSV